MEPRSYSVRPGLTKFSGAVDGARRSATVRPRRPTASGSRMGAVGGRYRRRSRCRSNAPSVNETQFGSCIRCTVLCTRCALTPRLNTATSKYTSTCAAGATVPEGLHSPLLLYFHALSWSGGGKGGRPPSPTLYPTPTVFGYNHVVVSPYHISDGNLYQSQHTSLVFDERLASTLLRYRLSSPV